MELNIITIDEEIMLKKLLLLSAMFAGMHCNTANSGAFATYLKRFGTTALCYTAVGVGMKYAVVGLAHAPHASMDVFGEIKNSMNPKQAELLRAMERSMDNLASIAWSIGTLSLGNVMMNCYSITQTIKSLGNTQKSSQKIEDQPEEEEYVLPRIFGTLTGLTVGMWIASKINA